MRRPLRSPFLDGALAALALAVLSPSSSWAQACCAGAGTLSPARLTEEERWGVGLTLRAAHQTGQHNGSGRWSPTADGLREESFEQQLFAVVRVLDRYQVALTVPVVQTIRGVPGLTDSGGGVGDLRAGLRWDLFPPGASDVMPGVALVGGVTLPTGRAAEKATHPLAADATGLGTATAQAGVALEQTDGTWLWQLSGQYIHTFDRTNGGWTFSPGPQWQAAAAAGRGFASVAGIALSATVRHDGESALDGITLAGSGRTMPGMGLSFGMPVARGWRVQAAMQMTPPWSQVGRSANGYLSATASVLRVGY